MFIELPFYKRLKWLRKFFKPEIYPESYFAYLNKLPDKIQVDWFRDDGMIIGKIKADNVEFMTQGKNARDFIQMVNESLIIAFDVPDDYFDIIRKTKRYNPPDKVLRELGDQSIMNQSFGLIKEEGKFKVA